MMQPTVKKSGSSASHIKEPSAVQKHFVLRSNATKSVGHGSTVSSWKSKDSSPSSRQSPEKMVFPETIYIPAWPPTPEVRQPPPTTANLPPSASGTGGFSTPLPLEEIGEEFEEEDGYRSRAGKIGLNGSMQESGRREANYPRPIDIEAIPTIGTQGSDGNEMQELKRYIPTSQKDFSRTELDLDLHQSILQTKGFDTSENDLTNGIDQDLSLRETHGEVSGYQTSQAARNHHVLVEAAEDDDYGTEATEIAVNYELSKYAGYSDDDEYMESQHGHHFAHVIDYHIPSPSLLLSYNTPKQPALPEHKSSDYQPRIFTRPKLADPAQSRRAKHQSFEVEETSAPRPSRSEEPKGYQRLPPPPSNKVTSGTGSRNDKVPGLPRAVNIHYSKDTTRDSDSVSNLALRSHRSRGSNSRDQRSVEVGMSSRKRERELTEFLLSKNNNKPFVR